MNTFFSLPSAIVLRAKGLHTIRYFHSRLTQNISSIEVGSGRRAAVITPQGKLQGIFTVLREEKDSLLFIFDGGDKEALTAALLQFRVTEIIELTELSELTLIHTVDQRSPHEDTSFSAFHGDTPWKQEDEIINFRSKRTLNEGRDYLVPASKVDSFKQRLLQSNSRELSEEEALIERILSLRPQFPLEASEGSLLAELDLDEYASFTKGCYAGQEVLERVSARGRAPKKFASLVIEQPVELEGNDTVGLLAEGKDNILLGKLRTYVCDQNSGCTYAFAILKNIPELESKESVKNAKILVNGSSGRILSLSQ